MCLIRTGHFPPLTRTPEGADAPFCYSENAQGTYGQGWAASQYLKGEEFHFGTTSACLFDLQTNNGGFFSFPFKK